MYAAIFLILPSLSNKVCSLLAGRSRMLFYMSCDPCSSTNHTFLHAGNHRRTYVPILFFSLTVVNLPPIAILTDNQRNRNTKEWEKNEDIRLDPDAIALVRRITSTFSRYSTEHILPPGVSVRRRPASFRLDVGA